MQRPMLKWAVVGVAASAVVCLLIAVGVYAGMQVVTRALRTTEVAIETAPPPTLPPALPDSPTPEARADCCCSQSRSHRGLGG